MLAGTQQVIRGKDKNTGNLVWKVVEGYPENGKLVYTTTFYPRNTKEFNAFELEPPFDDTVLCFITMKENNS